MVPRNSNFTVYNAVQGAGATETINSQAITVYLADNVGDILLCTGTVTITDTSTGYAKGCMYIKTDVGAGTGAMYLNKGTNTSSAFTLVSQA
jgi:hypothetical protein